MKASLFVTVIFGLFSASAFADSVPRDTAFAALQPGTVITLNNVEGYVGTSENFLLLSNYCALYAKPGTHISKTITITLTSYPSVERSFHYGDGTCYAPDSEMYNWHDKWTCAATYPVDDISLGNVVSSDTNVTGFGCNNLSVHGKNSPTVGDVVNHLSNSKMNIDAP